MELYCCIKELEINVFFMVFIFEKYVFFLFIDEKSLEFFCILECIMREEKIYKDNFIIKDKVVEILGINCIYLLCIINE